MSDTPRLDALTFGDIDYERRLWRLAHELERELHQLEREFADVKFKYEEALRNLA